MRRRKLWWVVAGLVVLLLAVGVFVAWPRPNRITQENFDRIQQGMSRAEVEAILGPPGDYRTLPQEFEPWALTSVAFQPSSKASFWHANTMSISMSISIEFDESGRAQGRSASTSQTIVNGPFDNLLWRVKRQWRRWFPE
jgi:hypothetical protein